MTPLGKVDVKVETDVHDSQAAAVLDAERRWVDIAALDRLTPGRGVAALVGGRQIAVFRIDGDGAGEVFAIDNLDPFSGAHVMSRGIVGDRGGVPKVASPMYKQSFDLRTGRCLDDETVHLASYPVRVSAGRVEVAVP